MRVSKKGSGSFFEKKTKNFFKISWPYFLITLLVVVYFWKYFIKDLLPIPADFIVGTYYPWLSYDWGVAAGVPVKNPVTSDVVSLIYPLRNYAFELLKNGIQPLWIPFMFAGYPLMANFQVAIFSPTSFLYLFFENIDAWSIQVVLQPIISSISMYSLFRYLKVKKLPAVTGGVIYAFSGFSMIWMEWNIHALCAAWIPVLVLFTKKYLDKKGKRNLIYISFLTALLIFSGYPQLFIYAFIAINLLIVMHKVSLKKYISVNIFLGMGVILTSIQTIPAFELLNLSQRGSETLDELMAFLPYQNLITLFAPDYFGNQATGNFWGLGNYSNTTAYTGIITFVLASVAVVSNFKKTKVKYFFWVFLIGLLLTLKSPISKATYTLELIGSEGASTTRSLVLVNFALSGLFAIGLSELKKIKMKHLWSLVIPCVAVMAGAWYSYANDMLVGLRNLMLPTLLLVTIAFLFLVNIKFNSKKLMGVTRILIVLLVVSELFRFGWKYTPFSPREYVFPATELTDFLRKDKINRVQFGEVIPMNMWAPYNLSALSGYDPVYPESIAKYIAVNNSKDIDAAPMERFAHLDNSTGSMVDIAGVNRILSLSSEYEKYDDDVEEIFDDGKVYVYENKSAIGRAMIYHDWKVIENEDDRYSYLLSDGFDPKNEVVVSSKVAIVKDRDIEATKANIFSYSNQEVLIDVESKKDAIVYLSDTYYPGWEVYVNGKKSEIFKVNNVFRGVLVRSGTNLIRFVYNPKSFKIGMWISSLTFILLISLYICSLRLTCKMPK